MDARSTPPRAATAPNQMTGRTSEGVGIPFRRATLGSATAPCVALPPASMQSSIPSPMRAAKLPARAALDWIVCGVERVRHERERWVGAALVYLIAAVVLHRVPFLGDLVLILLSPFLLGSLLQAAEQEAMPPPVALTRTNWRALAGVYLLQPLRGFGRLFRDEERLLPALMLSILVLGGIVLAQIVAYLLIGGSPVGGLNATSFTVAGRGGLLPLLLAIVLLLYLLLTMALFLQRTADRAQRSHAANLVVRKFSRLHAQRPAVIAVHAGLLPALRRDRERFQSFPLARLSNIIPARHRDAGGVPRRRPLQFPGALSPPARRDLTIKSRDARAGLPWRVACGLRLRPRPSFRFRPAGRLLARGAAPRARPAGRGLRPGCLY